MRYLAGSIEAFEIGAIKIVELAGRSVGIVRAEADVFFAVLNICPHEVAPVCEGALSGTVIPSRPGQAVYALQNRIVRCPWHGYEYNLEDAGRAAFTDFHGRLRLFPVVLDGDSVFVEMRPPRRVRDAG